MNQYSEGEHELIRVKPHPLAFCKYSLLWLYFILISIIGGLLLAENPDFIQQNIQIAGGNTDLLLIWAGLILIPMLLISLISLKPGFAIWGVILVLGGTFISFNSQTAQEIWETIINAEFLQSVWAQVGKPVIEAPFFLTVWTFVCAILGYIIIEIHRLSHTYIITNQRIIARIGSFRKLVRDILFSHTEEIVVYKGSLGKIFNFGCLIPLGEKIQQNIYLPAGETRTARRRRKIILGDKKIALPRKASFFVLWQVSAPEKILNLIEKELNRTGNKVTKKIKFSQPEPEETVIRTVSKLK